VLLGGTIPFVTNWGHQRRRCAHRDIAILLALELLLMGFALVAAVLAQPGLAGIAGTACISLAGQIARRLLGPPATPAGSAASPGRLRKSTGS
jgi:hypothetical protein